MCVWGRDAQRKEVCTKNKEAEQTLHLFGYAIHISSEIQMQLYCTAASMNMYLSI